MHPFISLIIPVYNVERYIDKCLQSICTQIETIDEDIEIIIVNDGTRDKSMCIVQKYQSVYCQIKVIEQSNQGLSAARNAGMDAAIGDYIWFIDSDDWLLPNSLRLVYKTLSIHQDIEVFASALEYVFEATETHEVEYYPKVNYLSGKKYLEYHYPPGASPRFIMKKEFLVRNKLRFYPCLLHEDGLFGYSMLYLAKKMFIFDKPLYAYLQREKGSIMGSISIKSAYDLVTIHKELKKFMQEFVALEDRTWYRACIYRIIECIYVFCRPLLHTEDFDLFMSKNGEYIHQETTFLCRKGITFLKGVLILYNPQLWLKCGDLKLSIKRLLFRTSLHQ